MHDALIVLSGILTLASTVPYVIEILKGKTKPRIVSWFTWSLLTSIAFAASLADKQYPAAFLMLFATIETVTVVILGLRYGDRKFEPFDIVCQVGAIIGLILWLLLNSPTVAVAATLIIDFVGGLPTLKHAWEKPGEETALTFFLAGVGGLCTVLIADSWKITAIAYPLYIAIINGVLVLVILARNKRILQGASAELRKL